MQSAKDHEALYREAIREEDCYYPGPGAIEDGVASLTPSNIAWGYVKSLPSALNMFVEHNFDNPDFLELTPDEVMQQPFFKTVESVITDLSKEDYSAVKINKTVLPTATKKVLGLPKKYILNGLAQRYARVLVVTSDTNIAARSMKAKQVANNVNFLGVDAVLSTASEVSEAYRKGEKLGYQGFCGTLTDYLKRPSGYYDAAFIDNELHRFCAKEGKNEGVLALLKQLLRIGAPIISYMPEYYVGDYVPLFRKMKVIHLQEYIAPCEAFTDGANVVNLDGIILTDPLVSNARLDRLARQYGYGVTHYTPKEYFWSPLFDPRLRVKDVLAAADFPDNAYFCVNVFTPLAHMDVLHTESDSQVLKLEYSKYHVVADTIKGVPMSLADVPQFTQGSYFVAEKTNGISATCELSPTGDPNSSMLYVRLDTGQTRQSRVKYKGPRIEFCAEFIQGPEGATLTVYDVISIDYMRDFSFMSRYAAFQRIVHSQGIPLLFKEWMISSKLMDMYDLVKEQGGEGVVCQPAFAKPLAYYNSIIGRDVGPARYIKFENSVDILEIDKKVYRHYINSERPKELRLDKVSGNSPEYARYLNGLPGNHILLDLLAHDNVQSYDVKSFSFWHTFEGEVFDLTGMTYKDKMALAATYPRPLDFPFSVLVDVRSAIYSFRYQWFQELMAYSCQSLGPDLWQYDNP